jgi:sugar lactone lactonase YvrE
MAPGQAFFFLFADQKRSVASTRCRPAVTSLVTFHGATLRYSVTLDEVSFVGVGLARPECVLCTRAGDLFAADRRGGVMHIYPNGDQCLYVGSTADLDRPLFPNGIALDRDGSFLVAHLSDDGGGVFRLARNGDIRPVLREVDGQLLPATNFVLLDDTGRLWITISTRQVPRDRSFRADANDGYIVLSDTKGARIVADGLGFANEVRVDPKGEWLYVNETYARRLSRFRISANGNLSDRETFAVFGHGSFPDGLAFDVEGGIWVTSIVSNRLIHIAENGVQTVVLEDCDPAHVEWVEEAYIAGRLGRQHIDRIEARALKSLSSLAFGGDDLRTAFLGVLLGERLPCIRLPIAGAPMAHWTWR